MLLAEHPSHKQCYRIFFALQSLKYDFIALKTLVALVWRYIKKKNVKIISSEDLEGGCKQKDNPTTTPLHMRQSCYNYRISIILLRKYYESSFDVSGPGV